MRAKIYGVKPSPPTHSVRMMAERKGIDHQMVWLLPGTHTAMVHARGFRGSSIPAVKLDGKRYQNSREVSRALEDACPEPRLFPESPRDRLEVEEAERWGEEVFQGAPRRIYRWVAANSNEFRVQLAEEMGLPIPSLAARFTAPVASIQGRRSGSTDQRTQASLSLLPALLERIEQLISRGVIGDTGNPNAADFQIVTNVRVLMTHEDLGPLIAARRAGKWAMELMPEYPGTVPALLPPEWLEPLRA